MGIPMTLSGRDIRADRAGNTAMLVALLAPVALVMVAMAIDTGAIAEQKRKLQGLADMAAIAAASNIDNAEGAVIDVLVDNNFLSDETDDLERSHRKKKWRRGTHGNYTVELGRYVADAELDFEERFTVSRGRVNAVRVSLKEAPVKYFGFMPGDRSAIRAHGTAAVSSEVAMSIGSRLLSLEDGLLNALLSELTGSEIELTLMDYRGLVDADIDLLQFSNALATNLDLKAATYDDVLDAKATMADVYTAMASASSAPSSASAALSKLGSDRKLAAVQVPLRDLFSFGSIGKLNLGEAPKGMGLSLDADQMLTAVAMVANGDRQVELDLGSSIAGLAGTRVTLQIGERPQGATWFSLTDDRQTYVSTAQLRLFVEASVGSGLGLSGELVRLPIYLELASAEARITDVVCKSGSATAKRVDVEVHPAIAKLEIADLKDGLAASTLDQPLKPAKLVDARLLKVSAFSRTSLSSPGPRTLRFNEHQIGGDPKTVETREALRGAISSAVGTLQFDINVLGLGLSSPTAIQGALSSTLQKAVGPADQLIEGLTNILGISVGEADVWVHGARCNRSVLVQ